MKGVRSDLQRERVIRVEVDPGDGQHLLRQRLPIAEERIFSEEDVDAGRREVSELLDETVDAMAGRHDVLLAD